MVPSMSITNLYLASCTCAILQPSDGEIEIQFWKIKRKQAKITIFALGSANIAGKEVLMVNDED